MVKTKHLTVMFTDIKGFTSKTSAQSRKEIHELIEMHEHLIEPVFLEFGGRIVKTIGDAFLVVFESPTDAVLCGMRVQDVLAEYNKDKKDTDRLEVRVAINSGEVNMKANDVFGEPVNIAARIESIAEPNEIYFTESVYLSMNKTEVPSAEVGQRYLKGIPHQIKVYRVLREGGFVKKFKSRKVKQMVLPSKPRTRKRKYLYIGLGVLAVLFLLAAAGPDDGESSTGQAALAEPGEFSPEPVKTDDRLDSRVREGLKAALDSRDERTFHEAIRKFESVDHEALSPGTMILAARLYLEVGEQLMMFDKLQYAVEKGPSDKEWENIIKQVVLVMWDVREEAPACARARDFLDNLFLTHEHREELKTHLPQEEGSCSWN